MTSKKKAKTVKKTDANVRRSLAAKANWAAKRKKSQAAVTPVDRSTSDVGILSVAEIHGIIETCHAKGVLSFQYGSLQLLFKKTIDEPKTHYAGTGRSSTLGELKGASSVAQIKRLQEESDTVSEELEHLKITDPAAYEEFIQSEDALDGDGP